MLLAQRRARRTQPVGRPPLIRPCGAWIEKRVSIPGLLLHPARDGGLHGLDRKLGRADRQAERLEQAQVDLDDVAPLGLIVRRREPGSWVSV